MTDERKPELDGEPAAPDAEELELEPDAGEPDAGEPELEPDAGGEEPDEEPSTQALLESLEREHSRHAKAIARATGTPLEELHACPTCEGVGFTPEAIEPPPPLVQDPTTETCSRCQGHSMVKTGATELGHPTRVCGLCGGTGYTTKEEYPEAGAGFGNGSGTVAAPVTFTPASSAEEPEVAALRARGYTVIDPIVVPSS